MAGKADIIFCLDASASMQPCIDGVREHLSAFLGSLTIAGQMPFDCRLDFVAHCTGETQDGRTVFSQRSVHHRELITPLYLTPRSAAGEDEFFTRDPAVFRHSLASVDVQGDEAPLVALDSCLDFPWSDDPRAHRVVILLTDEPFETGVYLEPQLAKLRDIKEKIQKLKVLLFMIAPESDIFDQLAAVDRCEYDVIDNQNDGLRNVDLRKVLSSIGRSVSASRQLSSSQERVSRGLFGQMGWGVSTNATFTGA